ncbi:MAG: leucine-rich repeat domain-containing protein, partial [Chitinispirillales bacterium]|nr:leucine-rich repeat domain-containing protein [Chitinispirillales bacterium]
MEAGNRFLKVMSAMVIAAVVAMGQVDITDKFTDPNFKAKVYKAINKTAPAPIYDSDVDTVKSLILANSRISSFAGIEYFTGLTTLDCDYNRLTTLDVSKNTALTELYCSSNQLTTLDVSKNTALTALDCSSNQLTTLDVSKNTELGWLDCSNNQLTTLDLSKNTELIYLDCSNNQLTTLDLSKMNTKSWWYLDVRANYLENESKILGLNELSMDVFYFHPQKTNNTNTVTFNSLGGSPVDQVTGVLGFSRINEPDEPTRDDYMFVGWYTDTEWKNLWNFTSNIVTQDTILYAKWHYTLGEDIEIFADTTTYIYDGGEQRIGTVRLYLKGEKKILEEGVGFTVDKYENNIDAGRNAIAMITLIDEYEHSGITKKPIQFEIQKCTVSVSWENTTFTYNGERQVPTPTSGNPKFPAKVIKTDYESINAGSNRVYAGLVEPNNNIILSGEQQAYTINPKEIRVIWGEEREFVYNKMIQHPAWSLESDEIDRNHVYIAPTYSVVGEYTEVNGLAPVVQIVPEHNSNIYHNNYTLVNTRVDYKILPKSLTARLKGTVNNKLSLSYKYETEAELEEHLSGMVEYVGFASDSTGTDSENDLRE